MIRKEQIEELLKMPVDDRRRVLQLLQASLAENKTGTPLVNGGQPSPAAKWLLAMAGRYSGGQGTRQFALMKFCALRSARRVLDLHRLTRSLPLPVLTLSKKENCK
jgi:hypothetical protein